METKLNWEKGFFKNTYEIYSGDKNIGKLKENVWSNTAIGELLENYQIYLFFIRSQFRLEPIFGL
jgi:hypothetical protein